MNEIISLKKDYLWSIVKLHRQSFPGRILSRINPSLLKDIYLLLLSSSGVYIIGNFRKAKLIGFVLAAKNIDSLFRTLASRIICSPHLIIKFLWQVIVQPIIFFKIFSLIFYPFKSRDSYTKSELLVIAVDRRYRRKNIGSGLINQLEKYFKKEGISSYKVNVEEKNNTARKFYNSLGFEERKLINQSGKKLAILIRNI